MELEHSGVVLIPCRKFNPIALQWLSHPPQKNLAKVGYKQDMKVFKKI
jgi:hypothetical protein